MGPSPSKSRKHSNKTSVQRSSAQNQEKSLACGQVPQMPLPFEPKPARWMDLLVVFGVALIIRIIYVLTASRLNPFFDVTLPGFDQATFQQWALKIMEGDWLSRHQGLFYYNPMYPYFLAILGLFFGAGEFWAIHWIQAILGAATCMLGFALASTWLRRKTCFVVAAIWILATPLLCYEQELLHEGLLFGLYVVMLWGLRTAQLDWRWAKLRLVIAGLACAMAILGRGHALALLITLPVWLFLEMPPRWRWGKAILWFAVGAIIIIGPLVARNYVVAHRLTLGMTNGKVMLYLGNASDATGEFAYSPRFSEAMQKASEDPNIYRKMLIEDLKQHPGAIIKNLFRKTFYFFRAQHLAANMNFHLARRLNPMLTFSPSQWEWFVPLGIIGLCMAAFLRRRDWILLWFFTVIFAASVILIIPVGRYRLPFLIPIFLGAGFVLEQVYDAWKQRSLDASFKIWAIMIAAILLGILLWPYDAQNKRLVRPNDYISLASAAIQSKRYDVGEKIIHLGLRDYPQTDFFAIPQMQIALHRAPTPQQRLQIANSMIAQRRLSEAIVPDLVDVFVENKDIASARRLIDSWLQAQPQNEQALQLRQKLSTLDTPSNISPSMPNAPSLP